MTPTVGTVVLTTHQDAAEVGLSAGTVVRVTSAGLASRVMIGTVTGYTGNTLTLDVVFTAGDTAADWVVTRPAGGISLALDPDPTLAADLDGAGRSIAALLNLTMLGQLTAGSLSVAGSASFAASGQSRVGQLGEVSGSVVLSADLPTTLVCTLVGDTTFLVSGADPGFEHAHKVRATIGGAGNWAVTVLPANLLTYSQDCRDTTDAGEARPTTYTNVLVTPDAATDAAGLPVADLVIADTATAIHGLARTGLAFDGVHTASVVVQASGLDRAILAVSNGTTTLYAAFDLAAGVLLASSDASADAADLGGGLWRLSVTHTLFGSGNSIALYVQSAGDVPTAFAGNGIDGVAVSDWQLVAGTVPLGITVVTASRAGMVRNQGSAIEWSALVAGSQVDVMIQADSDGRIVVQDYTPEEL